MWVVYPYAFVLLSEIVHTFFFDLLLSVWCFTELVISCYYIHEVIAIRKVETDGNHTLLVEPYMPPAEIKGGKGVMLTATQLPAWHKTSDVFYASLKHKIENHLDEHELDIDRLCDLMNMSRRNLFRKIKCSSGLTPAELVNELRLNRAAELIRSSDRRMYEIADAVGFKSRIVFTRNFTRRFGMSPSEFLRRHQQ